MPGERIEKPYSVRAGIGRQRDPLVELDRKPEREGDENHHPRPRPEPGQHKGENRQQDDVKRQDVHEGRLELQRQCLDYRQARLVEKIGGAELLGVKRVIEGTDRVRHCRHKHHEQKDMGDVELPHPVVDAHSGHQKTLALHGATVHHAGGVAAGRVIAGRDLELRRRCSRRSR